MNKQQQEGNSPEEIRQMLVTAVRVNTGKYIVGQKTIIDLLAEMKMPRKHPKNKKNCPICQMTKIYIKMGGFQIAIDQACKTFEMLFPNETIDVESITNSMMEEAFEPGYLAKAISRATNSANVEMPDDVPDSVKSTLNELISKLNKKGFSASKIEVIDITADNFGLKPEDFPDMPSFLKAIHDKREEASTKKGEEVLNDAMIRKAEEAIDNPTDTSKLN